MKVASIRYKDYTPVTLKEADMASAYTVKLVELTSDQIKKLKSRKSHPKTYEELVALYPTMHWVKVIPAENPDNHPLTKVFAKGN